jgi:hypothetical protein
VRRSRHRAEAEAYGSPMMLPMYADQFPLLAAGIVGFVLGFAIIRRIARDPDESPDHWRSHH